MFIYSNLHIYRPLRKVIEYADMHTNATSQGTKAASDQVVHTALICLVVERHCESKVSCPRTQCNDRGLGSNPDCLIISTAR